MVFSQWLYIELKVVLWPQLGSDMLCLEQVSALGLKKS